MSYADFLDNIENADITLREYRAARRMLDRVSDQGTLYLEREDACTLFGVNSWADVRRILGALKEAGVIDCHTNKRAYVLFMTPEMRAESVHPRAENAHTRADSAQPESIPESEPRAESAHPRAENAHPRAESARGCTDSARAYRLRQANRQANDNPPKPEGGMGEAEPADDEQARSVALLEDPEIGLDHTMASGLAQTYPFEEIRKQVFRFVRDRQAGTVKSAGVLGSRLKRKFAASVTDRDRTSELWCRHAKPDEVAIPLDVPEASDAYADLIIR